VGNGKVGVEEGKKQTGLCGRSIQKKRLLGAPRKMRVELGGAKGGGGVGARILRREKRTADQTSTVRQHGGRNKISRILEQKKKKKQKRESSGDINLLAVWTAA